MSLPPELAGIRQSLKIESYVLLYDDPRRIGTCFALAFMAPQELKTWGEEFDAMTHEDQEKQLQEFSSGLEEIGVALEKVFDIFPTEQARLESINGAVVDYFQIRFQKPDLAPQLPHLK